MNTEYPRTVRTFVRRQGRITKAQKKALKDLLPIYGLDPKEPINFEKIFNRKALIVLEIGFGMGNSLVEIAKTNPQHDFLGVEVHCPGVGCCLNAIKKEQLTNLRVINQDALEVLDKYIFNDSLDKILIYFPDPWPKKRHHKRRLISTKFLELIFPKMKSDAILHIATDWQPYAESIMEILSHFNGFENRAGQGKFSQRPKWRPFTKFEKRGERLGHDV